MIVLIPRIIARRIDRDEPISPDLICFAACFVRFPFLVIVD